MKTFILLLYFFGSIILLFACSSSESTINEQYKSDNEYTIRRDSISTSQLHKLLGDSVKKVVVTTEEAKISVQKVCEVTDSSMIILQRPDFELYQRRVAKFHEDYVLGKIKSEYCPELELPDTIIILINSIQSVNYTVEIPAEYSAYEYHEYPENRLQILGGGVEIDVRKNELTLDGFYEMQLGMYRPIFEYNTTFNNSENKLRISSSALYSLGYTFVGMFIGSAIVDEPSDSGGKRKSTADPMWLIVYLPLLLTNAEHHIFILNPSNVNTNNSFGLSIFAGFRTDIFNSEWIVYSPGAGIQIEYNWGEKSYSGSGNSMDFQIGIEYPYENRFNNFQEPKVTAGIKVKYL